MLPFLSAFLLGSAGAVYAGDFNASRVGTASAVFLELPAGARAAAMGGAYSAVADDATALYWNPASLTQVRGKDLTFMHASYVDSSFYDYAAYALDAGAVGSLGVGVQFLSIGAITQTDVMGNELGNFNPNDMAISLGYAHALAGMSLGASVKWIRSTILNTAQTQAVDIGLLSPGLWEDRARLSLVASNIGGRLRFEQTGSEIPLTLRAGGQLRLSDSWISSLDGVFPRDNAPYAAVGTEYRFPFSRTASGALRAGFNTQDLKDLGPMSAASAGLGLALGDLSVDYALLPMGALGLTHRFSLSFRWRNAPSKPQREEAVAGWLGAGVIAP